MTTATFVAFASVLHLWATLPLAWTRRAVVRRHPWLLGVVPGALTLACVGVALLWPALPPMLYLPLSAVAIWHWGRQNIGMLSLLGWEWSWTERRTREVAFIPGLVIFGTQQSWWVAPDLAVAAMYAGLALAGPGAFIVGAYYLLLFLPGEWAAVAPSVHGVSYTLLVAKGTRLVWVLLPLAVWGVYEMRSVGPGLLGGVIIAVNVVHFWYDSFLWRRGFRT